ncbi:metal-dependent phosphohydrolase [Capsaspora owczarzaki ATCC 30864]|uniref:Metal-dependent phosphohydrolase n=2 Tax=Capsaspora owczarzaki (strain ATCC 30864) TaxID=595528 RepID=A0A0D2WM63_CAPO3|nr:metal-dependent phosphohydrolase [Capsaspora owczarzaki ATCC 30864]
MTSIISTAEAFVREQMLGNDASHDWAHVDRVRNVAVRIAKREQAANPAIDLEIVELAGILHDVGDFKYSGSETAGEEMVVAFLKDQGYAADRAERVAYIVGNLSFRKELGKGAQAHAEPIELQIVQDADRLDAIGAIGVARCLTFGGAKHRTLHDPAIPALVNMTKEQYNGLKNKGTTMNHFPEKLLKLKDLMKTNTGREMAVTRHEFMLQFLDQFYAEWNGAV